MTKCYWTQSSESSTLNFEWISASGKLSLTTFELFFSSSTIYLSISFKDETAIRYWNVNCLFQSYTLLCSWALETSKPVKVFFFEGQLSISDLHDGFCCLRPFRKASLKLRLKFDSRLSSFELSSSHLYQLLNESTLNHRPETTYWYADCPFQVGTFSRSRYLDILQSPFQSRRKISSQLTSRSSMYK